VVKEELAETKKILSRRILKLNIFLLLRNIQKAALCLKYLLSLYLHTLYFKFLLCIFLKPRYWVFLETQKEEDSILSPIL